MNAFPQNPHNPRELGRIEQEAAVWILRRDRGLSATEQDEFSQWLAADPRHGACLAQQRQNWERLNQLAAWEPEHSPRPNRDLLAPPPKRFLALAPAQRRWFAGCALATAAVVAFGVYLASSRRPDPPALAPNTLLATIQQRTLDDGSVVELNRGAEVAVLYTPTERRVRLERGEAHFTVAKNPARPFIVSAGGVDVRAVGTAFDVRLDPSTVSVLVTEGHVRVDRPASATVAAAGPAALAAGQRAVVSLNTAAPLPAAVAVSVAEMDRLLAWQPRLLDFVSEPLGGIVAEFNRHNPVQIVVADPGLAAIPLSASFRSDNVEGFVRLVEAGFDVQAERVGNTITLRKVR